MADINNQKSNSTTGNKDMWWGWLTLLLLLAIIGFAAWSLYSGRQLSGVELIVGQLLSFITLLLGYRYGSSKGSKEKTELLTEREADTTSREIK